MKRSKYFKGVRGLIIGGVSLLGSMQVCAAPTQQQLEMFQQLSPAQQQQALKTLQTTQGNTPVARPFSTAVDVESAQIPQRKVERNEKIEAIAAEGADAPVLQEVGDAGKTVAGKKEKPAKPELKQFGYDLFAGSPTTFAPATGISVPSDYVVGPGDNIQIQLFGKENADYDLSVSREGMLRIPGLGPVSVAGLSFDELKQNLHDRIKRQMIGVKLNVSMGALRSIRVFVLGDVNRPGSYTISALSTMTNALFVSGGIRTIGSLRDIQLKRNGKLITRLDLYDLLLHGDTSGDKRLQPGDVIFAPPVGKITAVAGEVRRPAIYELKNEQTVQDMLSIAGGMLPTAYPKVTQLERITREGERTLLDIDATVSANLQQPVRDGDVVRVYSILEKMENIVLLSGHVQRPGGVQWHEGMRLLDVVPSVNNLLPKPDLEYVLIKREILPDRHIEVITTRYSEAQADRQSDINTELKPRDEIIIFGLESNRNEAIEAIIVHLREQERFNQPALIAGVHGNVRYPGDYPFSKGMRVSDLLKAAYDIKSNTDLNYSVLVREVEGGSKLYVQMFALKDIINRHGAVEDLVLMPKDNLYLFNIDEGRQTLLESVVAHLRRQATVNEPASVVSVRGLVNDPGDYPLTKGMRVKDLIIAGGGLAESAYELSAELNRFDVVGGEYHEINHYTVLQNQLPGNNATLDFRLQAYDQLQIKQLPLWVEKQTIDIRGEVKFPGSYTFRRGEHLADVLKRAGGLTEQAFPNGAVFTRNDLQEREQQQISHMAARLESDLAAVSLEQSQNQLKDQQDIQSVAMANSLLRQLKETRAMGRLVIDLQKVIDGATEEAGTEKIILKDGDKLFVPARTQEVTIIGEVQQSTSHLYSSGLSRDDYVNLSGGMTYKADEDRIYIVRANGAVVSENNSSWYQDGNTVLPGDTIVVPLNADRMKPLTLWTNVTQIIYQLGIAAAAWQTVGVL